MAALEIYSERVLVLRLVELKGDVGESIVVIAFVEGEMIVIMKVSERLIQVLFLHKSIIYYLLAILVFSELASVQKYIIDL